MKRFGYYIYLIICISLFSCNKSNHDFITTESYSWKNNQIIQNDYIATAINDTCYLNYQITNTINLTQEKVNELLKPSLDCLHLLKEDLDVLRYHLRINRLTLNEAFSSLTCFLPFIHCASSH